MFRSRFFVFDIAKIAKKIKTTKQKMASHEDFANFETSFAYFESRPHFFAYFKTPIIYFGTPHHPFLSHPHLPLKWGKMIF